MSGDGETCPGNTGHLFGGQFADSFSQMQFKHQQQQSSYHCRSKEAAACVTTSVKDVHRAVANTAAQSEPQLPSGEP